MADIALETVAACVAELTPELRADLIAVIDFYARYVDAEPQTVRRRLARLAELAESLAGHSVKAAADH